jgi:REP element-mobilizing transposase RayT
MRSRQLSFLPAPRTEHGGDVRKGRRKLQRPFDPKRPLHITARSDRARGSRSLLRQKWPLHGLLERCSAKYSIRVYRYANVGNHLHLLIQARSRKDLQSFLREFLGIIAVLVTGAIKGRAEKFWSSLAWSRVVTWGRDFRNTARYVLLNILETSGHRDRALLARLERDGIATVPPLPP